MARLVYQDHLALLGLPDLWDQLDRLAHLAHLVVMAYLDLMEAPGQMDNPVAQDLLDHLALLVQQERMVHRALRVHLVVKVYLDFPEMIMDYLARPAHLV